jgi:aspartate beta-hydroxylase
MAPSKAPPGPDDGRAARAAALSAAANTAVAAGRLAEARALLDQAVALEPGNLNLWMNLAACCRGLGDLAAALAATDGALAADPRFYVALLMKSSLLERLGEPHSAGAAYGIALSQAPPDDLLPAPLRGPTQHARDVHARYEDALADALRASVGDLAGRAGPDARRLNAFVDHLAGKRRVFHQQPVQFHYPGLPEVEFHDREDFPWMEAFEARTPDMLEELVGVLREDEGGLEPYVNYPSSVPLDQWTELNRSPRWSGYHLLLGGARVEDHCARCPRTIEAIAMLPQPDVAMRSPAAMFSVLQPNTRIPPHNGIANTRLVLHLPLIVPGGCGFRVGNETRAWQVGQAWVFDDTIEHEAWNDSDVARTILICDLWNPRLSPDERGMIAAVMSAMDAFNGAAPAQGTGL